MYFVYVIRSIKDGTFYIGKTANLESRLAFHNDIERNIGFTKGKIPWEYFFTLAVADSLVAGKIENHIKKMKSRRYLINLAKYPEIGQKLITKFS
ncbi:GIY-YIG nuclease family protein [Maribacter litopenaei]|uniref:GIY-YIG nuclease family protein n=1 Tax=Maribacter litopenaei TaxID=2976127 RepID=A0ABY5Y895_9FLAO|nr:GIY-YIG nuclease family protein [Maribacter litopenaei]UWX55237.1 GIY-YIG nuclease family protein [Maribacter litopenaei]